MNNNCNDLHEFVNELPLFHFPFNEADIPLSGIYILFEKGEKAHGVNRIVRIGSHTGKNQLRSRLKQHFISPNKDRSIFRKNVGRCILNRVGDGFLEQWEIDLTTRAAKDKYKGLIDREKQNNVEQEVTQYIQENFTFVVLQIEDKEKRLALESKMISTVSLCKECFPSKGWLGLHSPKDKIRESGLWLVNHLYKTPLSSADIAELKQFPGSIKSLPSYYRQEKKETNKSYKTVAKEAYACIDKMIQDVAEGETCFNGLLERHPNDGIIYLRMGEGYKSIYKKTGETIFREKAVKAFKNAVFYLPFEVWKQKARDNLQKLESSLETTAGATENNLLLNRIIHAVREEGKRVEELKNRTHYFVFGKTSEEIKEAGDKQFYEVSFENFPERVLIDIEYAKGASDLRIGGRFLKGFIVDCEKTNVTYKVPLSEFSPAEMKELTEDGIYHIADFSGANKQLEKFLLGKKHIKNNFIPYLTGKKQPERLCQFKLEVLNKYRNKYELDTYKWNSIEKSLNQNITFIWGPPGTGKTTVLSALSHILLEETDNRILLLTLSNTTLDFLFKKVVEYVYKYSDKSYSPEMFTRLGKPRDSTPMDIAPYYKSKISSDTRIVAANYLSLLYRGDSVGKFDYVIMDEVSMTPIPSLVAGSFFAKKAMVLAGDPYQLPPPYPEDSDQPNEFFSKNVFEMVDIEKRNDDRGAFLEKQYRMHEDISNLVSELFYDGDLKCGAKIEKLSFNNNLFPKAVFFRNTEGEMREIGIRREMHNRRNDLYAFAATRLAKNIIEKCGVAPEKIGIIVPYNAQVCNIHRYMKQAGIEGIKVNTVHAFQGQEKDVIIYDITDNNIEPSLLTKNWKLLNVALSRAKRFLCIIGNEEYLMSDMFPPDMTSRFEKMIEKGEWLEGNCDF